MKKIIEFLKNILIIALIIILLEVSYSKFIIKEYPTKLFGIALLIVSTGSMEPTIESGELIVVRKQDAYKIGDIVTYKDNEGFLITHRIVEKDNENIITKGDANNLKDEKSLLKKVEGKVIYHSKLLGTFVLYWLKPMVIVYFVILLIINLLRFSFRKKERRNKDEENKIVNIN